VEHGVFIGSIMASERPTAQQVRGRCRCRLTDGDDAVLRLQLRPILRARTLDGRSARPPTRTNCREISRQWFRSAPDGLVHVARTRRNSVLLKWISRRKDKVAERGRHRDRGREESPRRQWARYRRRRLETLLPSTPRGWTPRSPSPRSTTPPSAPPLPAQLVMAVDKPRKHRHVTVRAGTYRGVAPCARLRGALR